ncbi:hypothetical protein [Prosthecobacter sp.]|uniref:hypothetical protein n=1 Tax=Prosthecobacter sp. TaxID=1965333 RepID=UPI003783D331
MRFRCYPIKLPPIFLLSQSPELTPAARRLRSAQRQRAGCTARHRQTEALLAVATFRHRIRILFLPRWQVA